MPRHGDITAGEFHARVHRIVGRLLNADNFYIALLSTLNRQHELKVHVQGAIRNGCTKEEIREVLLHVAIYSGIPAAVDSFRVAKEALAELDKTPA